MLSCDLASIMFRIMSRRISCRSSRRIRRIGGPGRISRDCPIGHISRISRISRRDSMILVHQGCGRMEGRTPATTLLPSAARRQAGIPYLCPQAGATVNAFLAGLLEWRVNDRAEGPPGYLAMCGPRD